MRIGAAIRPKPGEAECGDSYLVCPQGNETLVAVIDGLGHGPEAAAASRTARKYIVEHQEDSLRSLMEGLHQAMMRTRGAAVTLLRFQPDTGEMSHAAVGNVEVAGLFRESVRPLCTPGVVGCNLRKVVEKRFSIRSGDILVAHTDGVSRRFDLERYRHLGAQALADAVLADWGKDHDDATCVAVCC